MMYGLSGAPIPASLNLPFASDIQRAAQNAGFTPCLAYSVAWRETIRQYGAQSATVVSGDGGHGIFQLTSWWPSNWSDPYTNAYWAMKSWLFPEAIYWNASHGYTGFTLEKVCTASFNAGRGAVLWALANGVQVDDVTTGDDYALDVWTQYQRLLARERPTPVATP